MDAVETGMPTEPPASAELEADTHLHIHKENDQLFPAVVAEELRSKLLVTTTGTGS